MIKNILTNINKIKYSFKNTKILLKLSTNNFVSAYSRMNMKNKFEKKQQELEKNKKNILLETQSHSTDINDNINSKEIAEKSSQLETKPDQTNLNLKKLKTYDSPIEALAALRDTQQRSINESVDIVIGLNVDIKRGDQVVRGIFKMPGGSNKIPKLIVFTSPPYYEAAKRAGADILGNESTLKEIQQGIINFEKCICTMDLLPSLKSVGKILGPKGLMPNVKVGTACTNDMLESIIKDIKTGSREFKVDAYGQILCPVGKRAFPDKNIFMNIDALMKILQEKRPDSIKGRYYLYAYMSTQGRSYRIDMKSLDPKSSSYFMNRFDI